MIDIEVWTIIINWNVSGNIFAMYMPIGMVSDHRKFLFQMFSQKSLHSVTWWMHKFLAMKVIQTTKCKAVGVCSFSGYFQILR